jgi:hypothetical protein
MANVRNFGATGDGTTDDTSALQHAVDQGDGIIELPRGTYRITRPIEINLEQHGWLGMAGAHGTARIVMAGPGPALRLVGHHGGTALPSTVQPLVWQRERMPQLSGFEIVGEHPEADGIQLVQAMQATLTGLLIRNVRYGVHLPDRNRNVLIHGCHIYDNSGIGIYFDQCNIHQAIISANHISYCKLAGIKALGGDLHNVQITGNDIEYNFDEQAEGAADVWFESAGGISSEVTIASNTIQAVVSRGGTNVRLIGSPTDPPVGTPLFAISGNVIGSQETNIELVHANRVAITGNTIYDGKNVSILARDSRHITCTGNTFGWDGPQKLEMNGGILLERCQNAVISGIVIEHEGPPDGTRGGAVVLRACERISVSNCQIHAPRQSGIYAEDCRMCQVSGNTVIGAAETSLHAAIEVVGGRDNLVQGNLVSRGSTDAIIASDGSASVQGNVVAGES